MSAVDWSATARVHERDDSGSDMDIQFRLLNEGQLGAMVAWVVAQPSAEQARIIVDIEGEGALNIGQVRALAARDDFPQAGE